MKKISFYAASLTAIGAAIFSVPVMGSTTFITGTDVLRTWNLVVLGDLTSSSEVEGRTFVGGSLHGNSSNYQIQPLKDSVPGVPGLTVVGNVTGNSKNLNHSSGAHIGGNVENHFNLNLDKVGTPQTVLVGGTIPKTNINDNTVTSNLNSSSSDFSNNLNLQKDHITTSMQALSHELSQKASNSQFTIPEHTKKGIFDAEPNADRVAIFNISAEDLDKIGEIQFNLNGADTAIINVSGTHITLDDNFLGGTANLGENVIWNFPNATDLSLTTAWGGSVLAPKAHAITKNYIQGSAVFGSLQQDGEMHIGTYKGSYSNPGSPNSSGGTSNSSGGTAVPEPSTLGFLALGLAGLAFWRRRQNAS